MPYGSGSMPSDQPMIQPWISWFPFVSLSTMVSKASSFGFTLTPMPLYCSVATWSSVSRTLLPEFATIENSSVLPSLA